jgi:hypothetical protein
MNNTTKNIIVGLLFAGAFLALGFAVSNRRAIAAVPARYDQTATLDPAVMSQIARAQASVALSQGSGAQGLLPFAI